MFIVIILMTVFQRGNLSVLFIAIGAVGWLTMARIVRGQTLVAASAGSSSRRRIATGSSTRGDPGAPHRAEPASAR